MFFYYLGNDNMKRKVLIALAATQLALFSSFAHADIVFSVSPDVCNNLGGNWNGSGSISALSGIVKCSYTGNATIPDQSDYHSFNMHVLLNKTSGAKICPATEDLTLVGGCNAGTLTLTTTEANLSGNLDTPTHGTVKGTLTVDKIKVKVDNMELRKQ
jgi:hypothetical protein